MRSSKPSSNVSGRAAVAALILILATLCFAQAARRPPQSEPVKKTQPTAPVAPPNKGEQHDERDQAIKLEATLVTVPVIASDHDGRYIPDSAGRSSVFSKTA